MAHGLSDWTVFKRNTDYVISSVRIPLLGTTVSTPPIRGKNIEKIDVLLVSWDGTVGSSDNVAVKAGHLERLILACKVWKHEKAAAHNRPAASEQSELYTRRLHAIENLLAEAYMQLKLLDANVNRAWNSYDRNKHRGAVPGAPPLKTLDVAYANERRSYEASGKTAAISGSRIIGAAHNSENPQSKTDKKVAKIIKGADPKTLSPDQWQLVGKAIGQDGSPPLVQYFSKLERLHALIATDANHLLVNPAGNLLNTGAKSYPYVFDEYGNMFCALDTPTAGYAMFNHSTLVAGKPVICAGMIQVDNGFVKMINNASGHYKPSPDHLRAAVNILLNILGADVSRLEMVLAADPNFRPDPDGPPPPPNTFRALGYTLDNFLNDGAHNATGYFPL